jgi:hypothetical protein
LVAHLPTGRTCSVFRHSLTWRMHRTAVQGCVQTGWCVARWGLHSHSWGHHLLLRSAGLVRCGLQQHAGSYCRSSTTQMHAKWHQANNKELQVAVIYCCTAAQELTADVVFIEYSISRHRPCS